MWLKWNVVKSCTDLYHSGIKMRAVTLDIVLEAAGTAYKKRQVMLAFWNIVSALSTPSFQRRQVQSQQGEKGAMAQAECIHDFCWPRAHRRQGLAGRCLQGVEVPRLRNIRNRKTKGPSSGSLLALLRHHSCLSRERSPEFANPEDRVGSTMRCL